MYNLVYIIGGLNGRDYGLEKLPEFGDNSVAWVYPKNSILRPIFNKVFFQLEEMGIKQREYQRYQIKGEASSSELIRVDLGFTTLMFAILVFGALVSCVTFSAELIMKCYARNYKK